ncbi:hypothetical protein [Pseudobacteriovorax antillogorgiicola]|uniref:Uncharacterized protein n=1 Tax=Pseudobacteriovorax antillogorgiicola TaxID=1513793 RepID=A0A1Y6CBP1_9BACT|nr:hypothetical protein [Pseudobacteriovorax antillogorgiicola]TCS48621.1 hypothetical protein EDD56_11743 [Pseudobacteriovorax antillogorgiicola]SMF55436.1 hypothetical protein SAMN06296036_117116 [Pseudobacteriovorax antillogorgiicola]
MTSKRAKISILMCFISFGGFSACTTTKPAFPKKYAQPKSSKTPSRKGQTISKQGEKVSKPVAPQVKNSHEALFSSLLVLDQRITDDELGEMSRINTPPAPRSFAEAILTLGNLKFVQRSAADSVASSQATDEANSASSAPKLLTIQEQFNRTDINLFDSLKENPYLQSLQVFQIVQATLAVSGDSERYREGVAEVLGSRIAMWQAFADQFQQTVPKEDGEDSLRQVASPVDPSQYRAADLLLGDTILLQAQKLAEKGQFKSAVGRASRVTSVDPFYPAAQEKIKYFSNLAVQELRQKAAQAFQSSLPVVDIKTKAAYLVEAKKYLEEALSDFPAADHLTTVRENLAVITRDLESIDQDVSPR